ncbi:hypothetical protein [Rhizorhabdus sp. FW153]|uniref:hypothetical protein n=1 Tax=Rhizorhabdus sp. FW153 TaxID=3400216 RepID=UPI003CEA7B7A
MTADGVTVRTCHAGGGEGGTFSETGGGGGPGTGVGAICLGGVGDVAVALRCARGGGAALRTSARSGEGIQAVVSSSAVTAKAAGRR